MLCACVCVRVHACVCVHVCALLLHPPGVSTYFAKQVTKQSVTFFLQDVSNWATVCNLEAELCCNSLAWEVGKYFNSALLQFRYTRCLSRNSCVCDDTLKGVQ